MPDKLRVGVVGTSWWADGLHLPSLAGHPRAELAAICGRNRERAQALADKYAIPLVFTDYNELIEQGHLDALFVLTPDDLHYPITMRALEAGLHVMCEKPLALDAMHAREMYEKAEAVGVKHGVFFTLRWLPPERYLLELVRDGFIGRPFDCDLRFLMGVGLNDAYQWRADRKRANGVLADLGSHLIDRARCYIGEIEKVSCSLAVFVERQGPGGQPLDPANDSASMLLQFTNGAQGTLQVSGLAHVAERSVLYQYTLHGEAGTLEADLSFAGCEIRGARRDEHKFHALTIPDRLWGESDRNERLGVFERDSAGGRAFVDAILEDRPFAPNFYDGWKAQQVIDAAIESDRTGCWVSIR